MTLLFNRRWSLTIGGDGSTPITQLRVAFKIKRTLEKSPNTAVITVTNLSPTNRGKLVSKGMPVVLSAGYEGNTGVIFSGDSRAINSTHEGADWNTEITCGDGEQVFNFARHNKAFGPGTSAKDVLKSAAEALGINVGNLEKAATFAEKVQVFKHGFAAFGPASTSLDKVAKAMGLEWSIQQGALQFRKPGEPAQTEAVLLTAQTGLVGSPTLKPPDAKGGPALLKVKSLLNSKLIPGNIVNVQSEQVAGEFIMRTVEHSGDSHGSDWFTEIECVKRPV